MKFVAFLKRYKLHHLLVWLFLFFGWHYFRYQDYRINGWWITFVKVADLALLVYVTNYLLIPYFLYKKKYVSFSILFIILIVSSSFLKLNIELKLMHYPMFNIWDRFKVRVYDNVIPHFLLVSTGAAFKLLMDYAKAQRRLGDMAKEKAVTELEFLKSQINPHFLFNSLNTIYFLIDKQNMEARQTLLQFSDLLRYQLYDCNSNTIEIEKEVSYLEDYIRLQRLRQDKQYEVAVKIGEEVKGFAITPLILIPFVENAFKHISHHTTSRNFIQVNLGRSNGTFTFTVENSKDDRQRSTQPSGGIGLTNVKRRLELLYPGKHELEIQNLPGKFRIALNLSLS